MPTDVLANPDQYLGKEIHWIGILRDISFNSDDVAVITLDQKYWDYIEDHSIQSERIFLSPKGEGKFLLLFPVKDKDEFMPFINEAIAREDLMFVYGVFSSIENKMPVLKYTNGRFIHEKYYSTKIFEYDIARSTNGEIKTNEIGVPVVINTKVLKVPGPGEND
jgi:hypothetical protein